VGARWRYSVPWLAVTVAGAGCSALLDMPAPQLGDGADAALEASSIDVGVPEASPGAPDAGADSSFDAAREAAADVALDMAVVDAPVDVALDQSSDAPPPQNGVACGFGSSCAQSALPDCCATADEAGAPTYACVSSASACSGYLIECANENDCPNNDICCHYNSGMRCETPSGGACPGGATTQACDPANNGECPARQACTLQLTINDMPSPYLGCQ
jgi:hypothetical protein